MLSSMPGLARLISAPPPALAGVLGPKISLSTKAGSVPAWLAASICARILGSTSLAPAAWRKACSPGVWAAAGTAGGGVPVRSPVAGGAGGGGVALKSVLAPGWAARSGPPGWGARLVAVTGGVGLAGSAGGESTLAAGGGVLEAGVSSGGALKPGGTLRGGSYIAMPLFAWLLPLLLFVFSTALAAQPLRA